MDTEWILATVAVLGLLITIGAAVLAWWGSSRFFAGQFSAWRKSSEDWREGLGMRLDGIERTIKESAFPALLERVRRAEVDIDHLREYKHLVIEPYVRAIDVLRHDVDRLDREKR